MLPMLQRPDEVRASPPYSLTSQKRLKRGQAQETIPGGLSRSFSFIKQN